MERMYDPGIPTLDQLRVFLKVLDTGSFAGAARDLGRATSVVSYTIANLEAQLGVHLFDRTRSRKPQLTQVGRAVASDARKVVQDVHQLRATVRSLPRQLEVEVALAVDVMLPAPRAIDVVRAFRTRFPAIPLRVRSETRGTALSLVRDRAVLIGICGQPPVAAAEFKRSRVGSVELLPVAVPDHPLALAGRNEPGAAFRHVQIACGDHAPLTEQAPGVPASVTWSVPDLVHRRNLLLEGVGWGVMPLPMVQKDIAAGQLTRLDLPEVVGGVYHFEAIHRTDAPLGPAASWLVAQFVEQTSMAS